tara:strand:+ start:605 stop:1618 length:1014 start_codon:yes stop_codon:yes gene_type:complete
MGLFRIKSMPAAVLLSFTAIVTFVYALNFMFFAECYVTGGAGDCFTLLSNDTIETSNSYGNGGPETAFNGVLMFGIFISTAIILNEGAKGKWTTMIPVIAGLTTMSAMLWIHWGDLDSSETPKYIVPVVLVAYIAAYWFLMNEDEVNDGLSEFSPGVNVKDTPALLALGLLTLMGIFYCFRALLDPQSVVDLVEGGDPAEGLGAPSTVTVAVGGSLFLVYLLWIMLTILDGPSGKWSIIHPGIFFTLAATIQTYISYVDDEVRRTITDQTIQDAVAGPFALLLTLFAYYRLRPEGIEDGMTYGGEEWENKAEDFNVMVIAFAMVLGLLYALNAVMDL